MPRIARIVVPGAPHHVIQRGNGGKDVFHTDSDRNLFLFMLRESCRQQELAIRSYCLMDNHVHLLAVPGKQASLVKGLQIVHQRYAQYYNHTRGVTGRLWQGRFFSCPLGPSHFLAAMRYVEQNPVRAGIAARAGLYPWSSAAANCGRRKDPLLAEGGGPKPSPEEYSRLLGEELDEATLESLREKTSTGRPLGDEEFLDRIERLLGRRVRPGKPGRPRKKR